MNISMYYRLYSQLSYQLNPAETCRVYNMNTIQCTLAVFKQLGVRMDL